MEFRISDTFTSSLGRLTNDEQKAVKITVFDLQSDPSNPGIQLHRIDRCKDQHFWSARVSRDIRLIVHKTDASLLICYVDHHDKAYEWAQRRRIETHPRTGAAQLVEIRETVQEIVVPRYVEAEEAALTPSTPVLASVSRDDLLDHGVPEDWLDDLLVADEDALFDIAEHLPGEAAEAVLELATGGRPTPALDVAAPATEDPFSHPDAQRRFRVVTDSEELQLALEYPWDRWTVFLHPAQRELVDREFSGPARVTGSAGTGKTIVAIHRAASLARNGKRVLLTTFSTSLARALASLLKRLVNDDDVLGRITVRSLDDVAAELYEVGHGTPQVPTASMVRVLLRDAASKMPETRFSLDFLVAEWTEVVDSWQIRDWESYRDVQRLGRRTRLAEKQRKQLWAIFAHALEALSTKGITTTSMMLHELAQHQSDSESRPFDCVVVDEAQDVSVPQLRFLAAVAGDAPDGLFFAGDLGQRIFRAPFSWKSLGVDVRGRSKTLRVNYRTSHQIRAAADRLLPSELADVDGVSDSRNGTVSVFSGPAPECVEHESEQAETKCIAEWLAACVDSGMAPGAIAVIVRENAQISRAKRAVQEASLRAVEIDGTQDPPRDAIVVCTMHLAKGLEFRAVAVIACDDEVVPLQSRIESVTDESDLEDVYNTERHLLYVACTRARDRLLVSGVDPASEFLDDLKLEER